MGEDVKDDAQARGEQVPLQQPTTRPASQTAVRLPYTMESAPSFLSLNDTKAGMDGLDKEKINQIILEASKDSPYFKRQVEKQKTLDKQIDDLRTRRSQLKESQIAEATLQMDAKALELEPQRTDLSKIIVHLDMDMFYAAVEMRDDPKLSNLPLAVGSNSMLATSNYEARKFGVRAGMAGFIARKLCPHLKIVPPDFEKYRAVSKEVMQVIAEYDPNYRSASLDEAYFDLTDYVAKRYKECNGEDSIPSESRSLPKAVWQMAANIVSELRSKIKDRTQLTCSAGIAHNRMIAKVCSDLNKPNGQYLLDASSLEIVQKFVDDTKIRKIGGIGQVQEQLLFKGLGIETCKELFDARGLIKLLCTPANIDFYLHVSLGISSNVIVESDDSKRKSLGSETTFKPTNDVRVLKKHLADISAQVSSELKEKKLQGKRITLIIKWATFVSNDRSKSHPFYTSDEKVICETVTSLLEKELDKQNTAIRLLGVRVSNFGDENGPTPGSPPAKKPKQKPITQFVKKSTKTSMKSGKTSTFPSESDRHDFVCVYCLEEFTDELSLEHHLERQVCSGNLEEILPPPAEQLKCPVCSKIFQNLNQLNEHLDQCVTK